MSASNLYLIRIRLIVALFLTRPLSSELHLDATILLNLFFRGSLVEFRANYEAAIQMRIAKGMMAREPQWTESIAVGSRAFVEEIAQTITHRQHLDYWPTGGGAWALRERATDAAHSA